jgi:hypothetical protein
MRRGMLHLSKKDTVTDLLRRHKSQTTEVKCMQIRDKVQYTPKSQTTEEVEMGT